MDFVLFLWKNGKTPELRRIPTFSGVEYEKGKSTFQFVAKGIDLLEEFFHIPIGSAFVLADDAQEAFAGFVQLVGKVHGAFAAFRCRTGMGIQLRHHRDFHTGGNHGAVGQIEAGTAVRGYGMEAIVFFQAIFEGFADQIFPRVPRKRSGVSGQSGESNSADLFCPRDR